MAPQLDQDLRKATMAADEELRIEILGVLTRHTLPIPVIAVVDALEGQPGIVGRGLVLETRLARCLEHLRHEGLVISEPAIPESVIDPAYSPMGYRITRQGEETLDLRDRIV